MQGDITKSWEREGLISGVHTEINEMEHMLEAVYQESMAKEKWTLGNVLLDVPM